MQSKKGTLNSLTYHKMPPNLAFDVTKPCDSFCFFAREKYLKKYFINDI